MTRIPTRLSILELCRNVRSIRLVSGPVAQAGIPLKQAREDRAFWGRLVESAVGAHLTNAAAMGDCEAYYWRERNRAVDFVVRAGNRLVAIEVKSGRAADTLAGMAAFSEAFRPTRKLLGGGIDIETSLLKPVEAWLKT